MRVDPLGAAGTNWPGFLSRTGRTCWHHTCTDHPGKLRGNKTFKKETHMANGSVTKAFAKADGGEAMSPVSTQSHDPAISGDATGTVDVITEVRREEALDRKSVVEGKRV